VWQYIQVLSSSSCPEISGSRTRSFLVRPSGRLNASIGHLLHYPTFHTKGPTENGEIADFSNPCLRLMLEKGFVPTTSFFHNRFCFRSQRTSSVDAPMKRWTGSQRKRHAWYTRYLMDNSSSQVWIIYGEDNRVWYLEQFLDVGAFKFETLPGCFVEGVVEYHRTDIFSDDRRVRRLVLFSFHPEYIFYRTLRRKGIMMDSLLNLAAALTGVSVKLRDFDLLNSVVKRSKYGTSTSSCPRISTVLSRHH